MRTLTLKYSLVGLALSVVACAGGEKTVVEPPPPGSGNLTVTVQADASENAAATALGWISGIPGAQVTLTAGDGSTRTATSSSAGVATFSEVADGKYDLATRRLLTTSEVAKVSSNDIVALVGDDSINVSVGARSQTVNALASRNGTLLISEWSFQPKDVTGIGEYNFGGFIELYNNADSTVYLDGVTIAEALSDPVEFTNFSCASLASFRNDPQGVWAEWIAAFPGSGREYPLSPGAIAVVATDAIDHRTISSDLLDLSRANFEFLGEADVDNPSVPNMIFEGLAPYPLGHGISGVYSVTSAVWIVGARTNVAQLTLAPLPPNGIKHFRFPTSGILDAFASRNTGLLNPSLALTSCPQLVNSNVDRKEGFFLQDDPNAFSRSASRKILTTRADGRAVLQNTKSTAIDFRTSTRTPGSIK